MKDILTGKCKAEFEAWLKFFYTTEPINFAGIFYSIPPEAQQGILLAFFRHEAIDIDVFGNINKELLTLSPFNELSDQSDFVRWRITTITSPILYGTEFTMAFKAAIRKANDIYNASK